MMSMSKKKRTSKKRNRISALQKHSKCDWFIEKRDIGKKHKRLVMRCSKHKGKDGKGSYMKWATEKEYEDYMSHQSDNSSDAK